MPGMKHNFNIDQDVQSLHCLQLPMRLLSLLVPMISVAEIDAVAFEKAQQHNPHKKWYYGQYDWHGVMIPLIDFDVLSCGEKPLESYRYIAVMHSQQENTAQPFYALVMKGVPSVCRIEYGDVSLESVDLPPFAFQAIMVDKHIYHIPDLLALEKEIAAL